MTLNDLRYSIREMAHPEENPSLRERLAAWLCEPLQMQINQLQGAYETLVDDCSKRFSQYDELISSLQQMQLSVAEDFRREQNAMIGAVTENKSRVRVARDWNQFAAAASATRRPKGAS